MYTSYALQTLDSLITKSTVKLPVKISTHPSTVRRLFTPTLASAVHPLPFTALLDAHPSTLYPLRKTAHAIASLLHCAPPQIRSRFAHDKPFILALARAYDHGLAAIAHSYGGIHIPYHSAPDHWQIIWAESKVALIDSFHLILTTILRDFASASGPALASESEHTFNILFALLDFPPSSPNSSTPFLNRPLLADYQHAYALAHSLPVALQHTPQKNDPRIDLLVSALRALSSSPPNDPGALNILLRATNPGLGKGKARAHSPGPAPHSHSDPELDAMIDQVLDILPDHPRTYVRALLVHPAYPFRGSSERVLAALLEGTAPAPADVDVCQDTGEALPERRNIWDGDVMDVENLRFGKKIQDETAVLGDRTFIDAMKADILRRAEAIAAEDDDADSVLDPAAVSDDDQDRVVRVLGDGEASDSASSAEDAAPPHQTPEIVLELAYIRDARLFERDSATRRGPPRADLRALTGWSDEQIEGWRIMLERNPKKDAILQKHEFAGNRAAAPVVPRGGAGRAGGRGRGGSGASSARERAWKDKNKASRGNHSRKRGHDRKVARAGAPS